MGEIRSKRGEGRELTKDQLAGADGECWGLCECSFESVQRADVLGAEARLVFGWIWDIAHPDVERYLPPIQY